ncbi:MAG: hypothetical protein KDC98_00120 [Planctomycetes bacterium]|nr:hypothetical protein [Planctomycetota bacterium]
MIRTPIVALALAASLAAQRRIPLDGTWQLRPEPGSAAAAPIDATVPAAFEDALGTAFDGIARYRRVLPLPAERSPHVRVEFAAVATHATVFCNGRKVGEHLGGWTPFRVDLTAALRWDGADTLEVVVDEKVGHNTQGFLPIIQPHFGGIWQGVTLCLDDGPVIDRLGLELFGTHRPNDGDDWSAEFACKVPVLDGADATIEAALLDGTKVLTRSTQRTPNGIPLTLSAKLAGIAPWSPPSPRLYDVRIRLLDGERELDRVDRKVGFRSLRADGTKVLWNGQPLQMRGILHWGYSPPHLAPPVDPEYWRRQLLEFRSLGFNCVKCCLWVPPACFYDLCDELGLLVWQEYPTWHPTMDQAHKQELLTEYGEFFVHDRNHPSVAFRSITCETGQGADLDVVTALFQACKKACPDTLVVDDSSWIGWQRITDFWDEHPYGNNSWFPGRLEDFKRHIAAKGEKPLLLGECIAADTWVDRTAWLLANGPAANWWRPLCWDTQTEVETWLRAEFGQPTLDSLRPLSLEFAMQNRKFQIEQLRMTIPEAGYVVSVARDFQKARMGLRDDNDVLKWRTEEWAWHGDTMLCLDLPWNGRGQSQTATSAPVRVSHFGSGRLEGKLHLWTDDGEAETTVPIALDPGTVSEPVPFTWRGNGNALRLVRVHAELTGSHTAANHWDLWVAPVWNYRGDDRVIEATALSPELLDEIENGARVLLHAGDREGSPRTESMWFLKGAPFAPPHPIHASLPREALLALSSFDLESGRVMPWAGWRDEVDPILAFWETHDSADTNLHLYAFDTRIGNGRLLVSTLRLDHPEGELHSFGFHLNYLLKEHLSHGPPSRHALTGATIKALRRKLTEKKIDLPVWRFRTDPADEGRDAGWQRPTTDVTTEKWRDLKAGSHWENQGEDLKHYTGVAWYRVDVDIPADWNGLDPRAVFEGVDDSFECWVNGTSVGRFGDPATGVTIWLERQIANLAETLRPGSTNTIVLRVVDHMGAGGLWKPVFLTTGPTGDRGRLLH